MSLRPLLGVAVLLAPALLMAGCACHQEQIVTHCGMTGDLQDVGPDVTYVSTGLASDVTCFSDSFSFGGWGPVTTPRDLTMVVRFHARESTQPAPTDDIFPFVQFQLTVHDLSLGPAEIDLDDTRAAIAGLSGLQGHMSISSLTQSCHDAYHCPIDLRATLSFSALEPVAGKTLSLTAADVYVHQMYANPEVMCMSGDGIGA